MRKTSILLMLLVLGLFLVAPAIAQEEHQCDHDAQTIESLRHCLEHAYAEGHITNAGIYRTLLAQVDAAQAAFDRGQFFVAAAQIQALIYTVESQAGITIEQPHAGHLAEHASNVRAALLAQ